MKNDMPGIVYLWNAVDPKCRKYLPLIEKMEAEYKGKVRVTKVDIYKSTGIANRLGVNQVPCLVVIKDGKISEVIKENICAEEIAATVCF
jgi:thioredoxin reductase (NADPH)